MKTHLVKHYDSISKKLDNLKISSKSLDKKTLTVTEKQLIKNNNELVEILKEINHITFENI